jgi:uncharacterized cupredoxin-like copper-binding protein
MQIRRRAGILIVSAIFLAAATACGDDSADNNDTSGGGGGAVGSTDVTEKDFSIALANSTLTSGDVTFHITNDGPAVHEFVVFKTDLDEADLPKTTDDDGNEIVDEEGEGVEAIDEVEDVAVDSTQDLDVTLDAGSYVAICNLPGHYDAGMHTSFTVE